MALKTNQLSQEYSSRLLNALVSNEGLQSIVDVAHEILENPLVITDMNNKLIGYSKGTDINDPLLNDIISNGFVPFEKMVLKLYTERNYDRDVYDKGIPFIKKINGSMYRRMYCKVSAKDHQLAYMVIYEHNRTFEDTDIDLAMLICDVLAMEIQKDQPSQKGTYNYETFLLELLEGKMNRESLLQNAVRSLNLRLGKIFYMLTIDFSQADSYAITNAFISKQLMELIPNGYITKYGVWSVILITSDTPIFDDKDKTLLDKISRLLKRNNLFAGLSLGYCNLSDTKKYFHQSIRALELRTRLNQNIHFCNYKDYMPYDLINAASFQNDLHKFCHPLVPKILDYDKVHNTLYAETLYAYITKAKDKFVTADYLHVHRNTMKYRIGKIEELFQIDWDDSELLLALLLTFKILEYEGQCDIFPGL